MAYALKYYHTFEDVNGDQYTWEILEDGWAGSTYTLTPSGRSFLTTHWAVAGDDEFSSIMPSETRLRFYDTATESVWTDLITALTNGEQDQKYSLRIKDDLGAVIWQGFVESGTVSAQDDLPRLTIELQAVDGLARLKDIDYLSNPANRTFYDGRVTLTAFLAELLGFLPWGLNFFVATDLYPYNGTAELTATDNPWDHIYVDRHIFRDTKEKDGKIETEQPVSVHSVLTALMERFGMRLQMWQGRWHAIQVDRLFNLTYTRWEYNSAGALVTGASAVSHTVADPSAISRQAAERESKVPYGSVSVEYIHGTTQLMENPELRLNWGSGLVTWCEPWQRTSILASLKYIAEQDWAVRIPTLRLMPNDPLPEQSGTGTALAPTAEYYIQDFVTQTYTAYIYQTAPTVVPQGERVAPYGSYYIVDSQNEGITVTNNGIYGAPVPAVMFVPVKVMADQYGGAGLKYMAQDGSWQDEVCWVMHPAQVGKNSLLVAGTSGSDALPWDAEITVYYGPVIEHPLQFSYGGGTIKYNSAYIYWDNCGLSLALADDTFNPSGRRTINYVNRGNPSVREFKTNMGDGPTTAHRTALTWNASGALDLTNYWKEGPITGGAPTDSLDELLARVVLRATRVARDIHSTTYYSDTHPGPIGALRRDGANWGPLQYSIDYEQATFTGSWYRCRLDGFTDDLDNIVIQNAGRGNLFGSGGSGVFAMTNLTSSFFNQIGKRITVTAEAIPKGTSTADVLVDAIAEPLLKAGQVILLVSNDLSFHELRITQDQQAGATRIYFEDAAVESSNYDFPVEIPAGAAIYMVEADLVTIARLGEQGFAITVKAQPIGFVYENTVNETASSLKVRDWTANLDADDSFFLQDGTQVFLTSAAYAGDLDSNPSPPPDFLDYLTLDIDDGAGGTINLDVQANEPIYATGQVTRTEFLITDGKISALIERNGERVARVDGDMVSPGTTVDVVGPDGTGGISVDLKQGDWIYFIDGTTGAATKRQVAADVAAAATQITLTSSIQASDGDPIVLSVLAGMRIDADGITFQNTAIYSDNWITGYGIFDPATGQITQSSTDGWIITAYGDAEFNNVTIRGNLDVGNITGALSMGANGEIVIGSGAVTIDPNGITIGVTSGTAYEQAKALAFGTYGSIYGLVPGSGQATYDLNFLWSSGSATTADMIWTAQDTTYTTTMQLTSSDTYAWLVSNASGSIGMEQDGKIKLGALSYTWPSSHATSGYVLTNDGTGVLTWAVGGGGASALNDLTDVTIGTNAVGHILYYTGSVYENKPGSDYYVTKGASSTIANPYTVTWAGATIEYTTVGASAIVQQTDAGIVTSYSGDGLSANNTFTIATSANNGHVNITPHGTGELRYNGTEVEVVGHTHSNYVRTDANSNVANPYYTQWDGATIEYTKISPTAIVQQTDAGLNVTIDGDSIAASGALAVSAGTDSHITFTTAGAGELRYNGTEVEVVGHTHSNYITTDANDSVASPYYTDWLGATIDYTRISGTGITQQDSAGSTTTIVGNVINVSSGGDYRVNGTTIIHAAVTFAGTPDYLTLSGQQITLGLIDLTTDVTGVLPSGNIGSHSHTASNISDFNTAVDTRLDTTQTISATWTWDDGLSVDYVQINPAGSITVSDTSGSTTSVSGNVINVSSGGDYRVNGTTIVHAAVTLAGTPDYLTLSGQQITLNQIDLTTDVTGVLPSGNIGSHLHNYGNVGGATAYRVAVFDNFGYLNFLSSGGTSGQFLVSGGGSSLPSWSSTLPSHSHTASDITDFNSSVDARLDTSQTINAAWAFNLNYLGVSGPTSGVTRIQAADGVNPTITLPSTTGTLCLTTGSSSITTVGTVTSGTWSASTIAVNKGGTGKTTWTSGKIAYASATDTIGELGLGTGLYITSTNLAIDTSYTGAGITTSGYTAGSPGSNTGYITVTVKTGTYRIACVAV